MLARFSGNALSATNEVDVLDGSLCIKSNQTLRNVIVNSIGFLVIDQAVILTNTGYLLFT